MKSRTSWWWSRQSSSSYSLSISSDKPGSAWLTAFSFPGSAWERSVSQALPALPGGIPRKIGVRGREQSPWYQSIPQAEPGDKQKPFVRLFPGTQMPETNTSPIKDRGRRRMPYISSRGLLLPSPLGKAHLFELRLGHAAPIRVPYLNRRRIAVDLVVVAVGILHRQLHALDAFGVGVPGQPDRIAPARHVFLDQERQVLR